MSVGSYCCLCFDRAVLTPTTCKGRTVSRKSDSWQHDAKWMRLKQAEKATYTILKSTDPDDRPQHRRFRVMTIIVRMFSQSKKKAGFFRD